MPEDHEVALSTAPPETVIPPAPLEISNQLAAALLLADEAQRSALSELASSNPRYIDVWAALAATTDNPVESYAYARVGYHRGLDALRASGWKGSGLVRFSNPSNQGFLLALNALRIAAARIGENDEEARCDLFLRQLDPTWPPANLKPQWPPANLDPTIRSGS